MWCDAILFSAQLCMCVIGFTISAKSKSEIDTQGGFKHKAKVMPWKKQNSLQAKCAFKLYISTRKKIKNIWHVGGNPCAIYAYRNLKPNG